MAKAVAKSKKISAKSKSSVVPGPSRAAGPPQGAEEQPPKKSPAKPRKPAKAAAKAARPSRAAGAAARSRPASGSIPSATARPRAKRACATCSAARAPTSPKWPISACRCRPGFTITDRGLHLFLRPRQDLPDGAEGAGREGARPCRQADRQGASAIPSNPLLVSVRSGARASMPGMMDTVLNLGLNDETVEALAELSGDRRFAYDSYRRFITDVFRRRARLRASSFRGHPRRPSRTARATRSTPTSAAEDWVELVGKYKDAVAQRDRQGRSRRIRTTSSGARSARCSHPG